MTNDTYAKFAMKTAPDLSSRVFTGVEVCLLLASIGMPGELGEVIELIKKHIFHGHPLDRERMVKELGDVEWYCNLLRETIGTTLQEVHEKNIAKLSARYPEGFFSTERSLNRATGDE